jgi:hypothetical protein
MGDVLFKKWIIQLSNSNNESNKNWQLSDIDKSVEMFDKIKQHLN